jgi:hypothetical protein
MVRSASSRVSNHEERVAILGDAAKTPLPAGLERGA